MRQCLRFPRPHPIVLVWAAALFFATIGNIAPGRRCGADRPQQPAQRAVPGQPAAAAVLPVQPAADAVAGTPLRAQAAAGGAGRRQRRVQLLHAALQRADRPQHGAERVRNQSGRTERLSLAAAAAHAAGAGVLPAARWSCCAPRAERPRCVPCWSGRPMSWRRWWCCW